MTHKIEEQELTAYALGELDEKRALEVEAALESDEAARRWVEEIRETSQLLTAELRNQTGVDLDDPRFTEVVAAGPRRQRRRRWAKRAAIASSAAVAFASVAAVLLLHPARQMESSMAYRQSETAYIDVWVQESDPTARIRQPAPQAVSEISAVSAPGGDEGYRAHQPEGPTRYASSHSSGEDNPFLEVSAEPLSTFSIDVDTASYAMLRRYLQGGTRPPRDAVRIEEMINYFDYRLPQPIGEDPIAVHVDVTDTPWRADHLLARVALKAREVSENERTDANLVFLIDVSGSMSPPDRLPLLVQGLHLLVEGLRDQDRVAIVVYAGAAGLVLPSTIGDRREEITNALNRLQSGGSTNGGAGIELAYRIAREHFMKGGINRVILATDGDFNVGVQSEAELVKLIREQAKSGVFLTVLGFGIGNYRDDALEQLADKGNGNYAYIDSLAEAKKVLVDQVGGTLNAIAKDVKIQIEFNPARIASYRLIGYENRMLRAEEFNDDRVDAGDVGAGHTVTALYELTPASGEQRPQVDALKYQESAYAATENVSSELFTIKLRYKEPEGATSRLIERAVHESQGHYTQGSTDLKFAAAVAGFGMLLRSSPHGGKVSYDLIRELAESGRGDDPKGQRAEFLQLVAAAARIAN